MCVGWYSARTCVTRWPFRRSHCVKQRFGSLGKEFEPCWRYDPMTLQPLACRNLTKWEPMNPSAPVTSATFFMEIVCPPALLEDFSYAAQECLSFLLPGVC